MRLPLFFTMLFMIPGCLGGPFKVTSPMSIARAAHTATLLHDGRVLVVGGWTGTGYYGGPTGFSQWTLETCETYLHPNWSTAPSLQHSRAWHTASLLQDGRVLVAGGHAGANSGGAGNITMTSSCEIFDPVLNTWSSASTMASVRSTHAAVTLPDGRILVSGGRSAYTNPNATTLASCEIYDPSLGTWSQTGSMSVKRFAHTMTLLNNGLVLAAGGLAGSQPTATCEIYDPSTGIWTQTAGMSDARGYFTATVQGNGSVLVAGGTLQPNVWLGPSVASVESYDPVSATWSPAGTLLKARALHAAIRLGSTTFFMGGRDSDGQCIDRIEEYDSWQNLWRRQWTVGARMELVVAPTGPSTFLITGGMRSVNGSYSPVCNVYD